MNETFLQEEAAHLAPGTSYIHQLFDKAEKILLEHRLENLDLYQMMEAYCMTITGNMLFNFQGTN